MLNFIKVKQMKKVLKFPILVLLLCSSGIFSQAGSFALFSSGSTEKQKVVVFIDEFTGYAIDRQGKIIYSSTDGGESWLYIKQPKPGEIKSIFIFSNGTNETSGSSLSSEGFMPADDWITADERKTAEKRTARINFSLNEPGIIGIKILDKSGNTIDEIERCSFQAGSHQVIWNDSKVAKGDYYYKLSGSGLQGINKLELENERK